MFPNTPNSWIAIKNTFTVREKHYEMLINLNTGARIFIDTTDQQKTDDMNLRVWSHFPGMQETALYHGTEVECMRVIEKLKEKFNATNITPWEDNT